MDEGQNLLQLGICFDSIQSTSSYDGVRTISIREKSMLTMSRDFARSLSDLIE